MEAEEELEGKYEEGEENVENQEKERRRWVGLDSLGRKLSN